jgi:lipopolysaccharide export LptBFGC system permease protein LptF
MESTKTAERRISLPLLVFVFCILTLSLSFLTTLPDYFRV